jgi:CCR4-NOT transcription complex subunit 9
VYFRPTIVWDVSSCFLSPVVVFSSVSPLFPPPPPPFFFLFFIPFLMGYSGTKLSLIHSYSHSHSLSFALSHTQGDDPEVINFLLSTEIIPLALHSMEVGDEVSKSVASFIVGKILMDDRGLEYICATYDRFYAVTKVLNSVVASLEEEPSPRLIKHVTRCYLSLSDNPR